MGAIILLLACALLKLVFCEVGMVLNGFLERGSCESVASAVLLAEKMGVSRQAVCEAFGRDVNSFRLKTLRKYARAVGGDIEIRFVKK